MIPNTDHKINIFHKTKKIVIDPPSQIIAKAVTRATAHCFTQSDARALVDVQPTNMGPQVILTDNITMDPEQVGH